MAKVELLIGFPEFKNYTSSTKSCYYNKMIYEIMNNKCKLNMSFNNKDNNKTVKELWDDIKKK